MGSGWKGDAPNFVFGGIEAHDRQSESSRILREFSSRNQLRKEHFGKV